MDIFDEYPSGADFERERNYRQRKRLEREEALEKERRAKAEAEAKQVDDDSHEPDLAEEYRVSSIAADEEKRRIEEAKIEERKRSKQRFLKEEEKEILPKRIHRACWRVPRKKEYKWHDSLLDFFSEHPMYEDRIESFANDRAYDSYERQLFPFAYPEDYIPNILCDLYLRDVSTTSAWYKNDGGTLWYERPFLDEDEDEDLKEGCDIETYIAVGIVDPYQVMKKCIDEALSDMEVELDNKLCVDIIMTISTLFHDYASSFIDEILLYFRENHPKIKVRVSVNEFKHTPGDDTAGLGWNYLLFG